MVPETGSRLVAIIYSPEYAPEVVVENPEVRFFPERGLYNIARLKHPGTNLVLLSWEPVGACELSRIAHVVGVDDWVRRFEQISIRYGGSGSLSSDLLRDRDASFRLLSLAKEHTTVELLGFAPSDSMDEVARILGASDAIKMRAARIGSKSGARSVLNDAQVPVPASDGLVHYSWSSVVAAARSLLAVRPEAAVYAKIDPASFGGGVGVRRLTGRHLTAEPADGLRGYAELVFRHGAIVECEVQGVLGSIGQFGQVGSDGVRTSAAYEQLMDGSKFLGGVYDSRRRDQTIARMTQAVGERLHDLGYRGDYGVDYVRTTRGAVAVEINLRKVGSLHSLAYGAALGGRSSDALFDDAEDAEPLLVAFRSFRVRPEVRRHWTELVEDVQSDQSRDLAGTSFITMRGAYESYGVFDAVVLADSRNDALAGLRMIEDHASNRRQSIAPATQGAE